MKPIELWHGDCLELMNDIPDESVDMILCDLPYGTTRNKWDKCIPLEKLWQEYKRVTKKNGAIVLFAQTPFDKVLGASNIAMLKYEWIWEKSQGTGHLNAKKMPMKSHENILVFYRRLPTYNPQWECGLPYAKTHSLHSTNYGKQKDNVVSISDGRRYPKDVLRFGKGETDKHLHPTQKPVALLEYLIKTYTNSGDTVLDNCMGSGSTGVACVNTNRFFIGIELDDEYFNIAKQRIDMSVQFTNT
jgi:site-specific DNA-methyltransferase (adenine-specific)